jgi:hypothetical protein
MHENPHPGICAAADSACLDSCFPSYREYGRMSMLTKVQSAPPASSLSDLEARSDPTLS